jgi:predicted regulator of Ras-like GTPase activity (Roadblock/LC7/MglB family)
MFQGLLKDVVDGTDGGVASVVMDLDGIALESSSKPNASFDIMTIGIELSVVLRSARQAAEALGAGATEELAIIAEQVTTVVRLVTPNYFVALSLVPGGNVGKGRYLLRTRAAELASELG